MVYKVVEFRGTPRIKISEEVGKITLPGGKQTLRVYLIDSVSPSFDVLCLAKEENEIIEKLQS